MLTPVGLRLFAAFLLSAATDAAIAQDPVKIGFILPMTGQQHSTGKQELAAIKALHGGARRHGRWQEGRTHH
jgi:hypothetical protein